MAIRSIFAHATGPGQRPGRDITLTALGKVSEGGAETIYEVCYPDLDGRAVVLTLPFVSYNQAGITMEVLLAMIADRLRGFQRGPFPSEYNDKALKSVECALTALKSRTLERTP